MNMNEQDCISSLCEQHRTALAGVISCSLLPQMSDISPLNSAPLGEGACCDGDVSEAVDEAETGVQDARQVHRLLALTYAIEARAYFHNLIVRHLNLPPTQFEALLPLSGLDPATSLEDMASSVLDGGDDSCGESSCSTSWTTVSRSRDSSAQQSAAEGMPSAEPASGGAGSSSDPRSETQQDNGCISSGSGPMWVPQELLRDGADATPFLDVLGTEGNAATDRGVDGEITFRGAIAQLVRMAIQDATSAGTDFSTDATHARLHPLVACSCSYRGYGAVVHAILQRACLKSNVEPSFVDATADDLANELDSERLSRDRAAQSGGDGDGDGDGSGNNDDGTGLAVAGRNGSTRSSLSRRLKVGGAAVLGGAALFFTGGLAAPAVASGVAALSSAGGLLGAAGGVVGGVTAMMGGVGGVTVIFGATGAGLAGYKMQRRTAGLTDFEFWPLRGNGSATLGEDELLDEGAINGSGADGVADVADPPRQRSRRCHRRGFGVVICVAGFLSEQRSSKMSVTGTIKRAMSTGAKSVPVESSQDSNVAIMSSAHWGAFGRARTHEVVFKEGSLGMRVAVEATVEARGARTNATPVAGAGAQGTRVVVTSVQPGGLADCSGVVAGSEVLSVAGQRVLQVADVVEAAQARPAKFLLQRPPGSDEHCDGLAPQPLSAGGGRSMAETNADGLGEVSSPDHESSASIEQEAETHAQLSPPSEWPVRFGEQHAMIWETDILREVGRSMQRFCHDMIRDYAAQEVIKQTALSAVYIATIVPATILRMADSIDNPWSMAMERAEAAGKELAEALLDGVHGGRSRPVTLVGYSLGARVVHACLQHLAAAPNRPRGAGSGLVTHAVLAGAAVPRDTAEWRCSRSVVSGRLINAYNANDWVLRFLFRYQSWEMRVAGLAPVYGAGIENVDVACIVPGHLQYATRMGDLMRLLRF